MRKDDEEPTTRGPGPTSDTDETTEADAGLAGGAAATPEEAAEQPGPGSHDDEEP